MNKTFKMKSVLAILVSIISIQSCNTPQEEIKIIGPAKNKTGIEMANTMGNFIPTTSPSIRPISIDAITPSPVITAKPPTILTTPKPYISIIPSTPTKAVSKLYTIPLSIDSGKVNAYLTPSSDTSGRFLVNFQDISDIPTKIQLLDQFGNNIIKSNNFNVSMAGNFVITYVKQADQKITKLQLFFVSGKMIEKIIDETFVSNEAEPTPIPPNPTPVPTPTIATNYPVTYIPTGAKVTTLAGSIAGYADGTGANAKFSFPAGIAVDSSNNLYVIDFDPYNSTSFVRKITPDGTVTTIAGSTVGFADGIGTSAQFANPFGIAVDNNGNIYVSDTNNNRIRKITPDGTVTTIAGSTQGYSDGVGTSAQFYSPFGIAVDNNGNVFVADSSNYKIRKITPDGTVTTIAGSTQGYLDGAGTSAQFETPAGLAIDNNTGNLFVADTLNKKIRKITPDGTVSTIAGSTQGYLDGAGTSSKFYNPYGVAVDNNGNVFVADTFNNKIRKIDASNNVTTIAGSTAGFADGFGLDSKFYYPIELTVDNSGKIYVSDSFNRKIRKISP